MNPFHLVENSKYSYYLTDVGGIGVCCVQQIVQAPLIAVVMGVAHISLQILPSSNNW